MMKEYPAIVYFCQWESFGVNSGVANEMFEEASLGSFGQNEHDCVYLHIQNCLVLPIMSTELEYSAYCRS